jgi:two-component system, LytTR family, sensor kinase
MRYDYAVERDRQGLRHWAPAGLIWLGISLLDALGTVSSLREQGRHHQWTTLFFTVMLTWLPWAAATPLIVRMGRRYPPLRSRTAPGWVAHAALIAGMTVVASAWTAVLYVALNPMLPDSETGPFGRLFRIKVESNVLEALLLYTFVLTISTVLDSHTRQAQQQTEAARLNELLSKAQLEALRRQIEPHFLFNTLHAIAGLVREKRNDDAVSMIARLSDLLRRTAEQPDAQVSLGEEMQFLEKYLEIQKARFAERLQVSVEVPEELTSAQVPGLLLQPMVENAVKHGISKRAQGGSIRISGVRENGALRLSVYNDGPALPADWEHTQVGVGLANIRTRLEMLYGQGFELKMRNHEPCGVEVSVALPFREVRSHVPADGSSARDDAEGRREAARADRG